MDLKSFYSPLTVEDREEFAKRCETSRGVLQNIMYGVRPCATDLAVLIERESQQAVRRWDLRPDDWFKHWPELIGSLDAPRVPAGQVVASANKPKPDAAHPVGKTTPRLKRREDHRPHGKPSPS